MSVAAQASKQTRAAHPIGNIVVINYRSLKKLLGETSLERKCRLLFGLALMILITTSFLVYAGQTRQLVEGQQVVKARALVPAILNRRHLNRFARANILEPARDISEQQTEPSNVPENQNDETPIKSQQTVWDVFQSRADLVEEFRLGANWDLQLPDKTPSDEHGHKAKGILEGGESEWYVFLDDAESGERELRYYAALRASDRCLTCHDGNSATAYASGEFTGMVSVVISMAVVESELSRNSAILLFSAIITTCIAMLVAYVIVRYIIVKPVQHLKDVSDEIARGNLNLRAEINTGDEFEELSQAFNRMLRHMTTVNDELRGVNDNLDAKVDQLAQANMELFRSNALKDEFLATMSHELRTPLNSILGFSDVLANSASLDDRQKRYVENIRTSGRNLMVQINDLLDLAKIESGRMKLQPGEVNLTDLIDNQCNQIMPLADQKNIELRIRHPESPLPLLQQDAGKIRQILTNLLSNAIKFTPEGGRVRVTTELVDEEMVQIRVEDTGIGIPMQEQSQIFEKFRQGTTTAGQRDHVKREYGGTGLGLSIVRELSHLLGGDVELESEFGKGSMFTVRIPIVVPPEPDPTQISLDSPSGVQQSITSVDLLNPRETSSTESAAAADTGGESDVAAEAIPQQAEEGSEPEVEQSNRSSEQESGPNPVADG